jgi:heme/copper-type cytochrome/quinol oxidase subunit 1
MAHGTYYGKQNYITIVLASLEYFFRSWQLQGNKLTMFRVICAVRAAAPVVAPRAAFVPRIMSVRAFATEEVVVPDVVDTLEWTLTSPPPLHQFEEPPIIVEIAHLDALPTPSH